MILMIFPIHLALTLQRVGLNVTTLVELVGSKQT